MLITVLETALPVFLTLGLGIVCRKKKLLSREGVAALKKVAVDITLPAVMFSAFATAEYSADRLMIPVVIFALCLLALGIGKGFCRLFRIPGKVSPFIAAGFEAGMLGYSLFPLLFGAEANPHFAIVDLGQVLFVFTVYKILLAGKGSGRDALREAISSPTIWAIAAGLLFGATGLYEALKPSGISGILDAAAGFVAKPTGTIILLSIGYELVPSEIRWKQTVRLVVMRIATVAVVLPLALACKALFLHDAMHTGALVLLMILPPPYVLPVFADAGEEQASISSTLSVLTLLSLIIFAILPFFFAG